ncbi:restriction endonuclease subunit S [Streptococcus sp. 11273D007BW]|nr:restriction endonuclease subunit S [Streptococcus sp.]
MTAKHKIPTYRFKGYDGMWEEKKLGEVSDYYNGNAYEEFVNSKGPFQLVTLKSVDMDGNLISSGKFIDGNFPTLNHGTLVMILSEQSPGLLGMTSIIPNDNRFILNQRVAEIRPSKNVNSQFLSKAINLHQRYFGKHGAGTKVQNISKRSVTNFKLSLPTLPEQEAIGTFFSILDRQITLHQRKLDTLKEQKKTYLKLLFPAKGQTKPALRFQGFEDDWEEVKLSAVISKEIKGKAKSEMQGSAEVYLETEYLNGGTKSFVDCEKDVEEDDILILWDGSQAGMVYHGFSGALGSTLKAYRPKESGKFIYYQLVSQQNLIFKKYRTPNIPHVIKTFTDEFRIFYSTLPEQEAIGTFFQTLDQEIAQVEDKLASLKEMKKTLLRKLFV